MSLSEPRGNLRFLDGLRGILCLIVVISHCVQLYLPSLRFTNDQTLTGRIEHYIACSPLNLFYSGLLPVSLFFVMSGFVISYKFNKTRDESLIIKGFLKRYFRFFIPISASYVIMYVLSCLFYPKQISFPTVLFETIFETYFRNIKTTNGVLWTISYELLGSFLIYSMLSIFGKQKNRIFFYFISLALTIDTQYSFFIFGLIMSDLYSSGYIRNLNKPYVLISMISFSLFISSYPIHYPMEGIYVGGVYKYITFTKFWDLNYGTYLRIGVFTFFLTLLRFSYLQRALENRQIMFLGKISFPLYLVHYMIAQSIDFQVGHVDNLYIPAAETVSVLVISIAISIPFEIYIDRKGIAVSNKIALRLLNFSPFQKGKI